MFNMPKKSMVTDAVMPNKKSFMKTSMMLTGATLAGMGAYASYKAIKNYNQENQMDMSFDQGYGYNDFDHSANTHHENCHRKHNNDYNELKKKVDEFNDSHKLSAEYQEHKDHHDNKQDNYNSQIKDKNDDKVDSAKFENKMK